MRQGTDIQLFLLKILTRPDLASHIKPDRSHGTLTDNNGVVHGFLINLEWVDKPISEILTTTHDALWS